MTPLIFQAQQTYSMPRPDRLYQRLRYQQRPLPIDADILRAILAEYGLSITGRVAAAGVPGRSQCVICATSAGAVLLKRYKDTIEPAAALHEHSILQRLAQIGFPAPRLKITCRGETLIQHAGGYYALFDALDGYFHYHQHIFLPEQTRQFITMSGAALGALHDALRDFTAEGRNPNGFISRSGDRWRELRWFTERLAQCRQDLAQLPAGHARALGRMLATHASQVEEQLHQLDDMLAAAAPPRLIIHGDYGPYNLFFKRNAPIVILDFELARLDWRLTDLATALPSFAGSRFGFSFAKMRRFLDGYQTYCPIDAAELRLLPDVWRFLTLRRVVVCWYRFCKTGGRQWLSEAQRRLDLAEWLVAISHKTFLNTS